MRFPAPLLMCLALAQPALAQQSPDYPKQRKVIIQLTSSQYSSGFGEYLVPPLEKALRKTGIRFASGPDADFAASVETGSDVGSWHVVNGKQVWLYQRFVTVGLSPADVDIEPMGKLAPSFSVTVNLTTPNEDRVDELNCLISLATRELAARYRPTGHVRVDGSGCARK